MDNNDMNIQQETPQTGLDLTPKQVGEDPVAEPQEETPVEQPKEEAPAEAPAKEAEPAKADAVTEDFVKGFIGEKLGDLATPELIAECNEQLKTIGITDKAMAEKALDYVCNARANFMIANTEASLKHFNSTFDNVTPEYAKAVADASVAVNAINSKVPGFKQMIDMAGIQGALPMILSMQMLKPLLGEDSNFMNGGTSGQAAPVTAAHALFGADKIRRG